MSETLIAALRKAADWGEGEFDVLSPQDAAAAADRIEALERELGWQDIATAPKDGTWILGIMAGYHPRTGDRYIPDVVHWDDGLWTENEHATSNDCEWPLTHWRPLPEPPAIRTGEAEQ